MLTIVIPSYNHEKYITDCLKAIEKTTLKNLKLIIIDDGSSDKTASLAEEFLGNNPQIQGRLIVKENKGLVDSLNLAISQVVTKYIYFCASDDIPIMEGIEKALCYANEKDADIVITQGYNRFEVTGNLTDIYRPAHKQFFEQLPMLSNEGVFEYYVHPILLQTSLFKVQVIKAVGGWDKDIRYDDYQLFIKLFLSGKFPLYKPSIYSCYYRHHGLNTYKNIPLQLAMREEVINRFAPVETQVRLKTLEYAYYMLMSLKGIKIKYIFDLLLRINKYNLIDVCKAMASLMNKKLRHKL